MWLLAALLRCEWHHILGYHKVRFTWFHCWASRVQVKFSWHRRQSSEFTWHRWWGWRSPLPASRNVPAASACACSPPGGDNQWWISWRWWKSTFRVVFYKFNLRIDGSFHLRLPWILVQLEQRSDDKQMVVGGTLQNCFESNLLQSLSNLKQSPSFLPASSAPMYSDIFFW